MINFYLKIKYDYYHCFFLGWKKYDFAHGGVFPIEIPFISRKNKKREKEKERYTSFLIFQMFVMTTCELSILLNWF